MDSLVATEALDHLARSLLEAGGATAGDAAVVSQVLVWGDRHGLPNQGVKWVPVLLRRLGSGLLRSPADMSWHHAGATSVLDAGDGFGQVAGVAALEAAVGQARTYGVGATAVRHSHHFGAAGAYVARAAEAQLVALAFSNAFPKVAAHGGSEPVLGTNPLAMGCPTSGEPVVVDLATSATAGSSVRALVDESLPVPDGLTLAGEPSVLRPAAGPKGTALGLAVELLTGVLAGGVAGPDVGSMFDTSDRPVRTSHLFVVIDPTRFGTMEGFAARADAVVRAIKGSRPEPGVAEVLVPGERRARKRRESDRAGIRLAPTTVRELDELGRQLGVALPW